MHVYLSSLLGGPMRVLSVWNKETVSDHLLIKNEVYIGPMASLCLVILSI